MNFQSLIDEINQFRDPKNIALLSDEKVKLHALGFEQIQALCSYAVQSQASPFVFYIVFTVFSTLLGPNLPGELLDQTIQQLISLPITSFEHASQLAISKCLATAIFHRLSPETKDAIIPFFQTLPPILRINFLSEYLRILEDADGVPFLTNSIFFSLTQIIPNFFDFIITSYLENPNEQMNTLFSSLMHFYSQPSLEHLVQSLQIEFNIEEFLFSIFSKFFALIPLIIETWQTKSITFDNNQKRHFISLIIGSLDLIAYGSIQKEQTLEAVNTFINLLLNPETNSFTNINSLFDFISTVLKKRFEDWTIPDIIIQFLNAVSDNVSQFDPEKNISYEILKDCLLTMNE